MSERNPDFLYPRDRGEVCLNMNNKILDSYSDQDIVERLLLNENKVVEFFFFKKCGPLLGYIIKEIFHGQAQKEELVNELYIYLSQNNWYKLRQFDYRSKLTTWVGVVATRFFIRKKDLLIDYAPTNVLNKKNASWDPFSKSIKRGDILRAIEQMENERYKMVILALDINERHPAKVADELGISLANLYNLHSRARAQLKSHMQKEDYYD